MLGGAGLLLLALLFGARWALSHMPKWMQELSPYPLPTHKIAYSSLIPKPPLTLFDRHGQPLDYWGTDLQQFFRPLSQIDSCVPEYVVFMEDAKFFAHEGFDVQEIRNSFKKNIERGKVKRGASTITQQLAKNLFLDRERSWTRKLFEIPWTLRLEEDLSKKQILELYVNSIEWGPDIYGVEAASRYYFDHSAAQLSKGECMYLALVIPSPVRFDGRRHPKVLDFIGKKREAMVRRLVDEKRISPDDADDYLEADFGLKNTQGLARAYPDRPGARVAFFEQMEKALLSSVKKRNSREIRSGLDRQLMRQLSELPEIDGDGGSRYLLVWEGSELRAARALARGKTVDPSALGFDFRFEERDQMPWNELLK